MATNVPPLGPTLMRLLPMTVARPCQPSKSIIPYDTSQIIPSHAVFDRRRCYESPHDEHERVPFHTKRDGNSNLRSLELRKGFRKEPAGRPTT